MFGTKLVLFNFVFIIGLEKDENMVAYSIDWLDPSRIPDNAGRASKKNILVTDFW